MVTYEVLSALKVALDNNFKQKVLLSFIEDPENYRSIIRVRLEDDFLMETYVGWFERDDMTCDQYLLTLLIKFRDMYKEVYGDAICHG